MNRHIIAKSQNDITFNYKVTLNYIHNTSTISDTLSDLVPFAQKKPVKNTHGTVVQWLSLLHKFIQINLNSRSAWLQILRAVCWRFAMVKIWSRLEIRLDVYHQSTIPPKQFSFIIFVITIITIRGLLLLVKLQAKTIPPPWVFFTFFKLYKWYQITQSITLCCPSLTEYAVSFLYYMHSTYKHLFKVRFRMLY